MADIEKVNVVDPILIPGSMSASIRLSRKEIIALRFLIDPERVDRAWKDAIAAGDPPYDQNKNFRDSNEFKAVLDDVYRTLLAVDTQAHEKTKEDA